MNRQRLGGKPITEMRLTQYEAATLYDYSNGPQTKWKQYLVLDLTDMSFGLCTCNDQGAVEILKKGSSNSSDLWNKFFESVQKALPESSRLSKEELEKGKDQLNTSLLNYYLSDRTMDSTALMLFSVELSCSEIDEAIQPVIENLQIFINQIQNTVDNTMLEDSGIILLGKAQELYPVEFYIRDSFSADPWLPDNRFRNNDYPDHYSEIVRKGEEIYNERNTLRHTYSLMLYDRVKQSFEAVCSLEKGMYKSELQNPEYIGPVFLAEGDVIEIGIDSIKKKVAVPDEFLRNNLVFLALGIYEDKESLFIRQETDESHASASPSIEAWIPLI